MDFFHVQKGLYFYKIKTITKILHKDTKQSNKKQKSKFNLQQTVITTTTIIKPIAKKEIDDNIQ